VKINAYQFGEMVIEGVKYHNDLIVFPDHIVDSWWRKRGHEILPEDLEEVFKQKDIEVLVIGKGEPGYMDISSAAKEKLEKQGIEVIIQPTKLAWKTYNDLSKTRKVVGAFHLTC